MAKIHELPRKMPPNLPPPMGERRIRIVSNGTSLSTKVLDCNGQEIVNVLAINCRIRRSGFVEAWIKFGNVELDLDADVQGVTIGKGD